MKWKQKKKKKKVYMKENVCLVLQLPLSYILMKIKTIKAIRII